MAMVYAETSAARTRQVVGDLVVALWVLVWIAVGMHLHDLVTVLAAPGEGLAAAGASLASGAERIAGVIDDAPLIGGGIAAPFSALSETGRDLASVGAATRAAAHDLALWLSVAAAAVPILLLGAPYLWYRAAWSRRAAAAARLRAQPGTVQLLALRAAVTRPLEELHRVSEDPLRDLAERPHVLAAIELRRLGLHASSRGSG